MQQERLPFKQRIRDEIRSGDWWALGGLVALFTILNWFFLKPVSYTHLTLPTKA